jgi:hypothetical protein
MMTIQTTFFLLSSFESSPCQKRLDQGVLQVLYVKYQCPWLQWILINTAASREIDYVLRLKDLVSFGCFSGGDFGAAIWRIPERGQGGNRVIPLQNVVNLQGHTHKIKWYPLSPFYSFLLAGCSWVCILITCILLLTAANWKHTRDKQKLLYVILLCIDGFLLYQQYSMVAIGET